MNTLMTQLHGDHRNLESLLVILEGQLTVFEAGDKPDYELIGNILDYFLSYPDECHHPGEDLIYRKLIQRDPDLRHEIDSLLKEHEVLQQLTRRFATLIGDVLLDAEISRQQIGALSREFIDTYRDHIRREEAIFLPRAEARLNAADWADISISLANHDDPLFGPRTHQEYRRLRHEIADMAAAADAGP